MSPFLPQVSTTPPPGILQGGAPPAIGPTLRPERHHLPLLFISVVGMNPGGLVFSFDKTSACPDRGLGDRSLNTSIHLVLVLISSPCHTAQTLNTYLELT